MAQLVKNPPAMRETWVRSLGWEDPLEKGKATHSSTLAWRISWTIQSIPGQHTGVGSLSLLQGVFPAQGSNPGLPHCGRILSQLSHEGSPLDVTALSGEGSPLDVTALSHEGSPRDVTALSPVL